MTDNHFIIQNIELPPLSLYVHIPWCVEKCPYCDFNSHALKGIIPENEYIEHLLSDLTSQLEYIQGRTLSSIFIGGGTPSLFSGKGIMKLLDEIKLLIPFSDNIEITMEANPGTAEAERFNQYHQAGITRLSMGVQSFTEDKLLILGRIHNSQEAINAVDYAKKSGFNSFNLDLMHGLPNQTVEQALYDLQKAIELEPPHLSWYQLTIEPNTLYASRPPRLPNDDTLWDIFEQGDKLLQASGYQQYETSAYAKEGFQCQHNLNYWRFGDYLAIGCGAHGKISFPDGRIKRYSQTKHPRGYMQGVYRFQSHEISAEERPFEYFMNRFRLLEAVPKQEFIRYTGLNILSVAEIMAEAKAKDYIIETEMSWQITPHGKLFLNELLELFLPE